jgi:hypothetical protein
LKFTSGCQAWVAVSAATQAVFIGREGGAVADSVRRDTANNRPRDSQLTVLHARHSTAYEKPATGAGIGYGYLGKIKDPETIGTQLSVKHDAGE